MAATNSPKFRPETPSRNGPCYIPPVSRGESREIRGPTGEPKSAAGVSVYSRTMTHATDQHAGARLITLAQAGAPSEDTRLHDALKRCSAATRHAAREYRRTGKVEWVPTIIHGLIEHYVEPEARAKLGGADDNLRLTEDLGVDSLTMLEIVFLAEEVLQVSIDNEELRPFKTVGDVKRFVASKLAGAAGHA